MVGSCLSRSTTKCNNRMPDNRHSKFKGRALSSLDDPFHSILRGLFLSSPVVKGPINLFHNNPSGPVLSNLKDLSLTDPSHPLICSHKDLMCNSHRDLMCSSHGDLMCSSHRKM